MVLVILVGGLIALFAADHEQNATHQAILAWIFLTGKIGVYSGRLGQGMMTLLKRD